MSTPDVTVVVCTFNRADLLRQALGSLVVLETGAQFTYEVLVVNNGSTDHTAAVVDEVARGAGVPVRYVLESRVGVAISRNRGIAEARGQWIAFFDDDQLAEPGWLRELVTLARAQSARTVAGARTLCLPKGYERPLPRLCRLLLGEDCGGPVTAGRFGNKSAPNTGNILIHRNVFEEVGIFDEAMTMSGEDTCLYFNMKQAGIKVWYTPDAVVQHIIPAYRLQDGYFRWTCLRHGWNGARMDHGKCSRLKCLWKLAVRSGHALIVTWPRLLWARARGDDPRALEQKCLLWRAEGYARGTANSLAPRLFPQETIAAQLTFQNERQLFASASTAP